MARSTSTNPFRYGSLVLDDAFTDREAELAELMADIRNGQDVVVFAPRRYGKSSLVARASRELIREGVLVAEVDLMSAPTLSRLAEKLAKTIHEDIASALFRARERLRVFRGLRIAPTVNVDPEDASLSFGFDASSRGADIDATLERLLELPAQLAAERDRTVALVIDGFQEIVDIDPELPKLMRSVFQHQADVAHVYLGSKRHMMERIFSDENEPFWRSAKRIELGVIEPDPFRVFIESRFSTTGRAIDSETIDAVLGVTRGHPYGTQELCYFVWQETAVGEKAGRQHFDAALTKVLRSEHAHFSSLWDDASSAQRVVLQALAREAGHPLAADYRRRNGLPGASTVQKALDALARREVIDRSRGESWIAEPFFAEWIQRSA